MFGKLCMTAQFYDLLCSKFIRPLGQRRHQTFHVGRAKYAESRIGETEYAFLKRLALRLISFPRTSRVIPAWYADQLKEFELIMVECVGLHIYFIRIMNSERG